MKLLTVTILTAAALIFLGLTVMFGSIFPLALISLALSAAAFILAGRLFMAWSTRGSLKAYRRLCEFEELP